MYSVEVKTRVYTDVKIGNRDADLEFGKELL